MTYFNNVKIEPYVFIFNRLIRDMKMRILHTADFRMFYLFAGKNLSQYFSIFSGFKCELHTLILFSTKLTVIINAISVPVNLLTVVI